MRGEGGGGHLFKNDLSWADASGEPVLVLEYNDTGLGLGLGLGLVLARHGVGEIQIHLGFELLGLHQRRCQPGRSGAGGLGNEITVDDVIKRF